MILEIKLKSKKKQGSEACPETSQTSNMERVTAIVSS